MTELEKLDKEIDQQLERFVDERRKFEELKEKRDELLRREIEHFRRH
jgi:hypothetical protein